MREIACATTGWQPETMTPKLQLGGKGRLRDLLRKTNKLHQFSVKISLVIPQGAATNKRPAPFLYRGKATRSPRCLMVRARFVKHTEPKLSTLTEVRASPGYLLLERGLPGPLLGSPRVKQWQVTGQVTKPSLLSFRSNPHSPYP